MGNERNRARKTMKIQLIFLLFFFMTSKQGVSQSWTNRLVLGGSVSAFKMWGGVKDRSSLSYSMSVDARYGVLSYLQAGADIGYGSFKPSYLGTSTMADQDDPFRTFVVPVNITLRATPLPDNQVKPYALIGLGALTWHLHNVGNRDGNLFSKGGFFWGENMTSRTNFALSYGFGFEWFVQDQLSIDFQGRNMNLLGKISDNVGYGDANDKLGEFRFSLIYYFGGKPDKDRDGIADALDASPDEPEDRDGFQDEDGAPDFDNDNDGIRDEYDKAPNEPEDFDGFMDDDGLPDPDNDNDGVLDVNDKAPMVAEDIDGFQDDDGVPDLDNDNDGILDKDDQCPNQAETVNGVDDLDGCPDQVKMPEVFQWDAFSLVEVTFATGSADINPQSYKNLDRLVLNLIEFPDVVIEIRGHTDNVGDAHMNQLLSEARADAVRDYILSKGISSDRVIAVGFGERFPIADNSTPEGRAKNRRIEMVRVK